MKFSEIYKYYSRRDVREAIFLESRDREFSWMNYDGSFGKRPYQLLNPDDIIELVRKGAVSFHISVERWENPLLLRQDMKKKEMDELRKGWDLLVDIDSPHWELSRDLAKFIIRVLERHGIERYGIKFSGSKGFHIIIPFESFPEEVGGKEVRILFPDLARIVSEYLDAFLKEDFLEYVEKKYSLEELSEISGKEVKDYSEISSMVQMDSMMMSKRHLFRAPYSFNEKSWLVSIPIKSLEDFEIEQARPENVDTGLRFLPEGRKNEAKYLFEVAYEWYNLRKAEERIDRGIRKLSISFKEKVPFDVFSPCIKRILSGLEDGRKRALFILMNFLANLGYSYDEIESIIWDWNEKNSPPLRESYIRSQLKWFKRKGKVYVTPNCDNEGYYKDMGVCLPDESCKGVRNPLSYVLRRYRRWLRRKGRER